MLQPESKSISVVAPDPLLQIAEMVASDHGKSNLQVVTEWLSAGAENTVVALLQEGRISKGYAVEALGTTYFGLDEILETKGVRLGLTDEQLWESQETGKSPGILKERPAE